jgi:hypothetical protein
MHRTFLLSEIDEIDTTKSNTIYNIFTPKEVYLSVANSYLRDNVKVLYIFYQ